MSWSVFGIALPNHWLTDSCGQPLNFMHRQNQKGEQRSPYNSALSYSQDKSQYP